MLTKIPSPEPDAESEIRKLLSPGTVTRESLEKLSSPKDQFSTMKRRTRGAVMGSVESPKNLFPEYSSIKIDV